MAYTISAVLRRSAAVLLAFALGAAWVHESRPHVYCASHQALEEAGSGPAVTARPYATLASAAADRAHEACSLVGQHPDRAPPPVLPAAALAARAGISAGADGSAGRPIDLLAVAPKTSPPRGLEPRIL